MRKLLLLLIGCFIMSSGFLKAELNLYGYFQAFGQTFNYENSNFDPMYVDANQFSLQQLNIFAANHFGNGFSAVVNLEFTSNYDSHDKIGHASVSEAYGLWQGFDGLLKVQAGYFIPKFGYLSTIANKSPLLPYIYRPVIFETDFTGFVGKPFYPEKGNLQVFGDYYLNDNLALNYSVYLTGAEREFWNKIDEQHQRTVLYQVGGRVGFDWTPNENIGIEAGFSGSLDKDSIVIDGYTGRTRIAADIGIRIWKFDLRAEYYNSMIDISDDVKNTLTSVDDLDKVSYYASLTFNATDKLYFNTFYTDWEDHNHEIFFGGLYVISAGAGYRLTDNIILKYQFHRFVLPKDAIVLIKEFTGAPIEEKEASSTSNLIGVSILF